MAFCEKRKPGGRRFKSYRRNSKPPGNQALRKALLSGGSSFIAISVATYQLRAVRSVVAEHLPSWYPPYAVHLHDQAAKEYRDAAGVLMSLAESLANKQAPTPSPIPAALVTVFKHLLEVKALTTHASILVEQASDKNDIRPTPG
jgi:hypothetical protein